MLQPHVPWGQTASVIRKEKTMPTQIFREEVQRLVEQEGASLVEVLPPAKYEDEHIAGAINMPLKTLNRAAVVGVDTSKAVITY